MDLKKNYNGIDLVKLIMAFGVVAIHLTPLAMFGENVQFIANILTRVAVPFFFCASGFYLKIKLDGADDKEAYNQTIQRFIKRILILYLVWTIIYLPCSMFWIKTDNKPLIRYIQECLFDGSYLHLWYLPSLIFAGIFISLIYKKLDTKKAVILSVILYFIGLFDTSYYGIIKNERLIHLVQRYDEIFITTRNGIFFGLVFVLLGFLAKENTCSLKRSLVMFIVSMIGVGVEMILLRELEIAKSFEGVIFSLPATYYLFQTAKSLKLKDSKIYRDMRHIGVIIYFAHCWVDFTYAVLCFNLLHRTFNSMIRYLYTIVLVSIIAILVEVCQKNERLKWLRILY